MSLLQDVRRWLAESDQPPNDTPDYGSDVVTELVAIIDAAERENGALRTTIEALQARLANAEDTIAEFSARLEDIW